MDSPVDSDGTRPTNHNPPCQPHPITLQSRSSKTSLVRTIRKTIAGRQLKEEGCSPHNSSEDGEPVRNGHRDVRTQHSLWVKSPSVINSDQGIKRKHESSSDEIVSDQEKSSRLSSAEDDLQAEVEAARE